MIIDAHNHPDWCGYNLERFLGNMAEYNIDVTWLLSWECPADEYWPGSRNALAPGMGSDSPMPFSRCVSYAERAPDKFVLGYAPDPRRPYAVENLEFAMKTYGVRVCGELKLRMMYDNWDAIRMFRFCGDNGLPVIVHIDYEHDTGENHPRRNWWYGGGIEALERAIKACQDTIFLGHAPGFWAHISGDDKYDKESYPTGKVLSGGKVPEMMRRHPNLYGDISAGSGCNALSRDPEFGKEFILEFQDRLLYARDYFDNAHQDFLNSLALPGDVLDKIYSGNALKLIPL